MPRRTEKFSFEKCRAVLAGLGEGPVARCGKCHSDVMASPQEGGIWSFKCHCKDKLDSGSAPREVPHEIIVTGCLSREEAVNEYRKFVNGGK